MVEQRGVRIPLSERSWRLIVDALCWVAKDTSYNEMEENREECGRIANYIEEKLRQKGGDTG
jgi:hypothetical protein